MSDFAKGYRKAVLDITKNAKDFQKIYDNQADVLTKILLDLGISMTEDEKHEYAKRIANMAGAAEGMKRFNSFLEDVFANGEECMLD